MSSHINLILTLAVLLLALALLLVGGALVKHEWHAARMRSVLGRAVLRASTPDPAKARAGRPEERPPSDAEPAASAAAATSARSDSDLPGHWLQTRWGRLLVADEDRRLIDQCGWPSLRAQLTLLVARVVLVFSLPALGWLLMSIGWLPRYGAMVLAIAFALGFLAPKWVLGAMASARRDRVGRELPLFVDLLRLLQGVGLSLDQSLQIMADDFSQPLKVLSHELLLANRRYSQGRSREHSLQRFATLHRNDDLAGLVTLLVQVDRHGGAVQEPLARYSERLREHRRAELKSRIGKITVKMTGVMVATLLPALVIVAAGPGFIAVTRSLGGMTK